LLWPWDFPGESGGIVLSKTIHQKTTK